MVTLAGFLQIFGEIRSWTFFENFEELYDTKFRRFEEIVNNSIRNSASITETTNFKTKSKYLGSKALYTKEIDRSAM